MRHLEPCQRAGAAERTGPGACGSNWPRPAKALEEADREAAAAGYEMETAQSQLREWEDAILKAEGEAAHCDSVVADLERQSSSQRRSWSS